MSEKLSAKERVVYSGLLSLGLLGGGVGGWNYDRLLDLVSDKETSAKMRVRRTRGGKEQRRPPQVGGPPKGTPTMGARDTFQQVKNSYMEMGYTGPEAEAAAARVVPEGAPSKVLAKARGAHKRRRPRGKPTKRGAEKFVQEAVAETAGAKPIRGPVQGPVRPPGVVGDATRKLGKWAKLGKFAGKAILPAAIIADLAFMGAAEGRRRKRASAYDELMTLGRPSVAKELRKRKNKENLAKRRAQLAKTDPEAFALLLEAVSGEDLPRLAPGEVLGGRQPQLSPTALDDIDSILEVLG